MNLSKNKDAAKLGYFELINNNNAELICETSYCYNGARWIYKDNFDEAGENFPLLLRYTLCDLCMEELITTANLKNETEKDGSETEMFFAAHIDGIIWGIGLSIESAKEDALRWLKSYNNYYDPSEPEFVHIATFSFIEISEEEYNDFADFGFDPNSSLQQDIIKRIQE